MRQSGYIKRCGNLMLCGVVIFSVCNIMNLFLTGSNLIEYGPFQSYLAANYSTQMERFTPKRFVHEVQCKNIIEGDDTEIKKALEFMKKNKYQTREDAGFINLTRECHHFRKSEGYEKSMVTQEELDFPIAYSILMYKNVDQVNTLLRTIYRKHNVYCIHVDASADDIIHKAISGISNCLENVFVASKTEDVIYEGISRLQADINCMTDLLKHKIKWKYFFNLPSQQFPLKTNLEIVKILTIYNGANDIEGISNPGRMLSFRYKNVHILNGTRLIKTSKIKDRPPHNISVVKGSAYGIFSRDFVDFIINDQRAKDTLKWSQDVRSPDEYFWATLNHNKVLNAPGSYSGVPDKKPWLAVYASWGGRDQCHGKFVRGVCVFGVGDLPELVSKKELFANKLYTEYQPLALQCLEEWIHNKSINTLPLDLYFYRHLPFIKKNP